jgi:hypothetical protein
MTEDRPERRKYPRFEISFPMSFRFLRSDTRSGDSQSIEAIGTKTQGRVGNISLEGLFIEANPTEDQIREIMRAKRDREQLDIEIETRLMGETVNLMGRLVWYDIILSKDRPYHFRAGVFLGQLGGQTQKLWGNLISSLEQ